MIVGKVQSSFLKPNLDTHFSFLESQLQSAPNGGPYLCGRDFTAADIMMSFPLIAAFDRSVSREQYPLLGAYADRLQQLDGYKRAVQKIEEVEGTFKASL